MAEYRRDYLSELLQAVASRSRRLFGLEDAEAGPGVPVNSLAEALLSTRGEASGVALASALLDRWLKMTSAERRDWFILLERDYGPDTAALGAAVEAWQADRSPSSAGRLHEAAEPRRQELLRRMNLAPGGTARLVKMREALLEEMKETAELAPVDADFAHLFASWFNRGFLMLRRIDWSSPADILEKIIRYEAVHEIQNWNDLRGRIQPADRRCFAFFHPQMHDEPLVFVEVALTRGIPREIAPLIAEDRVPIRDNNADTAVFYSISSTQYGLRGISFGNFLIKQVVEELLRELPELKTFVTLSPVPGFANWLAGKRESHMIGRLDPQFFSLLDDPAWHTNAETRSLLQPLLEHAAALYLLEAKSGIGKPADPVARFHLNNGAQLEQINFCGDLSSKGLRQSHGIMVNYLYDPKAIERNHELFANTGETAASSAVKKLVLEVNPGTISRSLQALLPRRQG